jgi:hypothetical protein
VIFVAYYSCKGGGGYVVGLFKGLCKRTEENPNPRLRRP